MDCPCHIECNAHNLLNSTRVWIEHCERHSEANVARLERDVKTLEGELAKAACQMAALVKGDE